MKAWRVTLVAVALVAITACSDDDDTATTTAPPTTAAPATTAAATTTPAVSDAELAQSALLTIDDMPAGWKPSPLDEDEDAQDAANVQRIAECSGLDASLIGDGVLGDSKAKSPDLDSPDELASVKHTIGLASDEDTAIAAITAIGDDQLAPCYEDAMRASFEDAATTTDPSASLVDGMTLTDISMQRIDPPVDVGADDAVWYSAKASLDYQGQAIDIYLDLLFTRTGRVLSQLEFDGTTVRFPEDQFEPTIRASQTKIDSIAAA